MRLEVINVNEIEVGERYRKDMGDIVSLASSIKEQGLINPIAVSTQDGELPYLLLAGGRRLAATKFNKSETIPARIYDRQLEPLQVRSIELTENMQRKDMEWREQLQLQAEIHRIQQEIHGTKANNIPGGWSTSDTAELVGRSRSSVSLDLSLAEAHEKVPDLFRDCKNKAQAMKALKKLSTVITNEALSAEYERKNSHNNKLKQLLDSYILGDFFERVKDVPSSSIDIVELDPPYGINLNKERINRQGSTSMTHYNEVPRDEYPDFIKGVLRECFRTMKSNSWLLCWFGTQWFNNIHEWIVETGFQCRPTPIIWVKDRGQCQRPLIHLATSYEFCFYARKGEPTICSQGRLAHYNASSPVDRIHPTERPVKLIEEILTTFGRPGSVVLSPFLGSGNTILAANNVQMSAFGYELSKEYREAFVVRTTKEYTEVKNSQE